MKNLLLKVILPLGAIIGMLAFITIYNPIQKENAAGCNPTDPNTSLSNWCVGHQQHYTCDNGGIIVYIDPVANSCSNKTTSFSSSMNITTGGNNPGAYTIHWGWLSNFCTSTSGICDTNNPTNTNTLQPGSLNGNSSTTATSKTMSPSGQFSGLACGAYQNDFGFYVTKNSNGSSVCGVSISGTQLDSTNNNATWCNTGTTCNVPVTPSVTQPVTPTVTQPVTPSVTQPVTPTVTQPVTPTVTQPVVTPTSTNTNNCDSTTQVAVDGSTNNNNCNQNTNTNNNNNNNSNNQSQGQSQTQNNNQTVNISLTNNGGGQQQQQQQVLAAATTTTAPTSLPSTGAESDILFGLLGLIPVGWKLRKLV